MYLSTISHSALAAFSATMLGSALLLWQRDWAKKNIWRVLAFASGVLLGVAFLHIFPEAVEMAPHGAGLGALSALLLIFAIEGFTMMHSCAEYAEDCHVHSISNSAFVALAAHSVLDGMAIALAFKDSVVLGQAVAAAILVHKFTDGLTLTGLLVGTHYSRRVCLGIVFVIALATPLGAGLFAVWGSGIAPSVMGYGLGFIAGIFFYVGAADILPRLHRVKDLACLAAFILGLLVGGIHLG